MRLGIDIQGDRIFAALIKRRAAQWEIVKVFKKIGLEGISELRQELPFFGVKTIVAVPRKNVFVKDIGLDKDLSEKDIVLYLEKSISKWPEFPKDCYFDFEPILNSSKAHIRIVAVEQQWMKTFLMPLKKRPFRIIAVDVDELARIRGLAAKPSVSPEFITAFGLALWEPRDEY